MFKSSFLSVFQLAKMTAVIGQIIQGFKEFLSKLEEMSKYVVSELEKFSIEAAQKIQVLLTAVFHEIKDKISKLIKVFQTKMESLLKRRPQSSVGPAGTSYSTRIRNALKTAGKDAENVASKFKASSEAVLKDAKEIITKLAGEVEKGTTAVGDFIKKAATDVYLALKNAGEGAIKETKSFISGFSKDIEVSADFSHKHDAMIAEAATIGIFSPILLLSLVASGGLVYGTFKGCIEPIEKQQQLQVLQDNTSLNGNTSISTSTTTR